MRNLLRRLGTLNDSAAAAADAGFDADRREFARRLDELLAARKSKPEELAYRIVAPLDNLKLATVIERTLGTNDLYVRSNNDGHLVVFPFLARWESRLKAATMMRDIGRAIPGAKVNVEEVSLSADGNVVFAACGDLDAMLTAFIAEAESVMTRDGAQNPGIAAASDVPPAEIDTGSCTRTLAGIDFVYRPMLTAQTNIVSTFLVVPVREISENRFDSGYGVLDNPRDPLDILELDQLTVARISSEIRDFIDSGGRSLFAIPVHFETLANQRRGRDYCRLLGERLAGIEKRVVFEMIGLPDKVPQARLTELVTALAPTSRAVIARFPSDSFEFTDYRSTGLHAVGIDVYTSTKRERTLMGEIDRFVDTARKSRLKSYIQGVRSLSMLTAAISAGFDYVAGHALGQPCTRAEDVRTFQMGQMYRVAPSAYPAPRQQIVA